MITWAIYAAKAAVEALVVGVALIVQAVGPTEKAPEPPPPPTCQEPDRLTPEARELCEGLRAPVTVPLGEVVAP